MNLSRFPIRQIPSYAVLGTALALPCFNALGCDIKGNDTSSNRIDIRQEAQPDVMLSSWMNGLSGAGVDGCKPRQQIRLEFTPSITGLEFVRHVSIDRKTYAAYGWGPQSPLIIFRLTTATLAGTIYTPLGIDTPINTYAYTGAELQPDVGAARIYVQYSLLSRGGGAMIAGTAPRVSGTTRMISPSSRRTIPHTHNFTVNVASPACTLSPRTTDLPAVAAGMLAREGDTALEQALDVHMECPFEGIGVELSLTDASNAGNVGSELTPAKGSAAQGVTLQLLRNGAPVQFRSTWEHGISTAGSQTIPLRVRYRRTREPLSAGGITGEAILSANYR